MSKVVGRFPLGNSPLPLWIWDLEPSVLAGRSHQLAPLRRVAPLSRRAECQQASAPLPAGHRGESPAPVRLRLLGSRGHRYRTSLCHTVVISKPVCCTLAPVRDLSFPPRASRRPVLPS